MKNIKNHFMSKCLSLLKCSKIYAPIEEERALPTVTEIVAKAWFRDKGDETHRLNYDLNERSIVVDVGGYKGQWSSDIYSMYKPQKIIIYEAISTYAQHIQDRFSKNSNIIVRAYGLGGENRRETIYLSDDASTVYNRGSSELELEINVVDGTEAFTNEGIEKIDLLKINIEGCEYELLENLIASSWIKKVVNLQVQFHDNVFGYEEKIVKITGMLSRTHKRTYCYPMVWENWQLK